MLGLEDELKELQKKKRILLIVAALYGGVFGTHCTELVCELINNYSFSSVESILTILNGIYFYIFGKAYNKNYLKVEDLKEQIRERKKY